MLNSILKRKAGEFVMSTDPDATIDVDLVKGTMKALTESLSDIEKADAKPVDVRIAEDLIVKMKNLDREERRLVDTIARNTEELERVRRAAKALKAATDTMAKSIRDSEKGYFYNNDPH